MNILILTSIRDDVVYHGTFPPRRFPEGIQCLRNCKGWKYVAVIYGYFFAETVKAMITFIGLICR